MQNDRWQDIRRDLDPSWDELRERRVLGRVLAEVRTGKRARPTRQARWMLGGAGVVAAAAAVMLVLFSPEPRAQTAALPSELPSNEEGLLAAPAEPSTPTLRFADGSMAELWADAQVVSTAQTTQAVEIEQRAGRVRYGVAERAERRFVVRAQNVAITVLAAAFEVEVRRTEIEVRVQAGQLQVEQADRRLSLHAGESVRLASPAPAAAAGEPSREREARAPSRRQRVSGAAARPQTKTLVAHEGTQEEEAAAHDPIAEGLRAADQARRTGDLARASRVLQALISAHGSDARVPSASFTLGRVERSRGRHRDAARAFEACLHADPRGPLAEDALAEAAIAWSAAGELTRSRALATEYLTRFASSTHSARIRTLLR